MSETTDKAATGREINITELINLIYPVGSIYITTNEISPSTLFGGTWEQIQDRFLLSAGSTYRAGNSGGAATVALTTNQLPSHSHSSSLEGAGGHTHTRGSMNITGRVAMMDDHMNNNAPTGAFWYETSTDTMDWKSGSDWYPSWWCNFDASRNWTGETSNNGWHSHNVTVSNTGGGESHENMPPYVVVYVWKRVS